MLKKIAALLTALCLFFTMGVCAATDLSFLKEVYNSYESTTEISFTLNKPVDFLNSLLESLFENNMATSFADVDKLVESVFDGSSKVDAKVNISKDFKKINASFECAQKSPLYFNRNLSFDVKAASGVWLDFDISNSENPKYELILKSPYMDKYIKYDVFELISETNPEGKADLMGLDLIFNEVSLKGISAAAVDLLGECAEVSKSGNVVTLKLDDAGAKKYFGGVFNATKDAMERAQAANGAEKKLFLPEVTENTDDMKEFGELLNKVRILGKDGVVLKYRLSGSRVGSLETDINVDLDIGGIMRAFGADEVECSGFDGMNFDFTAHIKTVYRNINGSVNVKKPEITDENTVFLKDLINGNFSEADYDYRDTSIWLSEEEFVTGEKGSMYLGIRNLFENAYNTEFDIGYNNGAVTVDAATDEYGFKSIKATVGSNIINLDGKEIRLRYPVIQRGSKVYVDTLFVESVFGYKLCSAQHDMVDNSVSYYFDGDIE